MDVWNTDDKSPLYQAEELLINAINLNPEYYEAYYQLGEVYYYLHKKDETIHVLLKAIGINPMKIEPYQLLSTTYSLYGDRYNNFYVTREMTKPPLCFFDPEPDYTLLRLGNYYIWLFDDYEHGINCYLQILSRSPDFPDVYHNLIQAYYDLEYYDLAYEYYYLLKELSNRGIENAEFYLGLSEILLGIN